MNRSLFRIAMALSFALFSLMSYAKSDARADIVLTDGSTIENVELELPRVWNNEFKYSVSGDKNKAKIKSEDIDHIVLWHKDAADNKLYVKRLQCGEFKHKTGEYKKIDKKKEWFMLESAGDNLVYWVMFWQLKVKSKKIDLILGDGPSFPGTPYYFQRKDDDVAYKIAYDATRMGMTRDWLKAFLSDDPELGERITEKGYFNRKKAMRHGGNDYNPFLFEEIAVDYNPVR